MTREQAAVIWPVMKAYAEGKEVQFLAYSGEWVNARDHSFSQQLSWREKPKPREFWIMPHAGFGCGLALEHKPDGQSIHVREVE